MTKQEDIHIRDDIVQEMPPTTARSRPLVTILVGAVMLVVGLLAGYFGRPLVALQPPDGVTVAEAGGATPSPAGETDASAAGSSAGTLMDAVVAQTRHFKGSPDAPITIVEFSDFQ